MSLFAGLFREEGNVVKLVDLRKKEADLKLELDLIQTSIRKKEEKNFRLRVNKAQHEGFVPIGKHALKSTGNSFYPNDYSWDEYVGFEEFFRRDSFDPHAFRWLYGKVPPKKVVDPNGRRYIFVGLFHDSYDNDGQYCSQLVAGYRKVNRSR